MDCPTKQKSRTMPKKPILTAEAVVGQYEMLNNRERERFQDLIDFGYEIDLDSADTVYLLYENLDEDERQRFHEMAGWESEIDEANDTAVRATLRSFSFALAVARRQQEMKRRRRPAWEKHLIWKQWRDEEGLSYGRIAMRHKVQTGEKVSANTVSKALKRVEKREPSKKP
jgi:hypothetical protein